MANRREVPTFRLVSIAAFDARRGLRKCQPPGVGVTVEGRAGSAEASFWRDRDGALVVRFSSQGYRLHFLATLPSGGPVPPTAMDDFSSYVSDTLFDWLIEGVDDMPDSITARSATT